MICFILGIAFNWRGLKMVYATFDGTAWKVFKYGVFSSPHFPLFGLNIEKYGPEKTPYLNSFHAVWFYPS